MTDPKPTMPPTVDDARATAFGAKLATLEAARPARTNSGMLRILAEAWAHLRESGK